MTTLLTLRVSSPKNRQRLLKRAVFKVLKVLLFGQLPQESSEITETRWRQAVRTAIRAVSSPKNRQRLLKRVTVNIFTTKISVSSPKNRQRLLKLENARAELACAFGQLPQESSEITETSTNLEGLYYSLVSAPPRIVRDY